MILLLNAILSVPALSQEIDDETVFDDPAAEAEVDDQEDVVDEPEPDPEIDETGLDEQGFADEDDDFDPSEKIPTDQSIEFPTDI